MTDQPQEAVRSAGKVGRPSKYNPDLIPTFLANAEVGKSMMACAAAIGVCEDTLYEWAKVHPEFSEAIKKAKQLALLWWEEQGRLNLEEGEKKFNHVLWYMNMKNRHGWADKQEVKATVSVDIAERLQRGIERAGNTR